MEYCAGGSLKCRGFRNIDLDLSSMKRGLFSNIERNVAYPYRFGYVHRDIRAENIYVWTQSLNEKVGEFGLSRRLEEDSH